MTVRAVVFLLIAIGGVIAGSVLLTGVYRSGSGYSPEWIAAINPGDLSVKHRFLNQQCESCHTPFIGVEARSCITCHADNPVLLGRQSTAFHATIQDCRGCHVEHQGSATRPILIDHAQLVLTGLRAERSRKSEDRDLKAEIESFIANLSGRTQVPESQALDCATCHSNRNPHHDGATQTNGTTASSPNGGSLSGGDCAGCQSTASPATIGSLFGRDCAACHVLTTWKIVGYRHPSPNSTDCAQCHQAPSSHYMMHFKMISMMVAGQPLARVEQCYLCHQTDAWNDIKGVGWFKHH